MSSYDQTLLNEAPKATRAQLQEGYSVDLLEQPPRRGPSVRHPPPPQSPQPPPIPTAPVTPAIPETDSREKFGSSLYAPKPQTSFWRTRNGVIAIVLIALIVVCAVVGGAVGGTISAAAHKSTGDASTNTTGTNQQSSPGDSATQSVQGVSPISPSSSSHSTTTSGSIPVSTQTGQNTGGPGQGQSGGTGNLNFD